MALTRDFKHSVEERIQADSNFGRALLDEAIGLFLNGQPRVARLMLRDLANATIGFEALAQLSQKPAKSLHRMLSSQGNPTMDNLALIINLLRNRLEIEFEVHSVELKTA